MKRGALLGLIWLAGCAASEVSPPPDDDGRDPLTVPMDGLDADQIERFRRGERRFVTALTEEHGVGPLFIQSACSSCHAVVTAELGVVRKMAVIDPDGRPSDDQSMLAFGHTVRERTAAGAVIPIVAPDHPTVMTSIRIGPSLLGRGYLEAVDEGEIERTAAAQANRTDRIAGRINRVVGASEPNPDTAFRARAEEGVSIGRFGWKARIGTVEDFVADALQGDMGLTSPLRPTELPNPDGVADDAKPGIDVDREFVGDIAAYVRLLAIPPRRGLTDRGRALFERAECSVCHVPTMRTRDDYPVEQLRAIKAPLYTDLLLHDMGRELADGIAEGDANWREWRTPALIGLRFAAAYLHDGRARSIEEAIVLHEGSGSEGAGSARLFASMSEADRAELVAFVSAL